MTEAERQMMNTIHMYGRIFSMNDDAKNQVLDYMEEILKEAQHEQ